MGPPPWGKWRKGMARLLCQQLVVTVEEHGRERLESFRKPSQQGGWRVREGGSGPGTGGPGRSEVGRGWRRGAYRGEAK